MTWVLLRGLIREKRYWGDFPDRLEQRLGERVVAPNLPGNGTRWRETSPLSVASMASRLRGELDELGERPPYKVLALSLGAMTALSWLAQWPEEVATAVLINTSSARFSPFWQRLRPSVWGRLLFQVLLNPDLVSREHNIVDITTNCLDEPTKQELARRWAGYDREYPVSKANSLRQLWAAARFRASPELPGQVPVLLVNGAGDHLVNPLCSDAMARGWQLPLERHPRAGHDLPLDAPDWLLDVVDGWSRQHAGVPESRQ